MPFLHEMIPSKYLTKHDLDIPRTLTIKDIILNQFNDGQKKWIIHFYETTKIMTLNSTNLKLLASILNSENSDDWINKRISVYFDPEIMYKAQRVGGIRFKVTKQSQTQTQAQTIVNNDNLHEDNKIDDSDVPF